MTTTGATINRRLKRATQACDPDESKLLSVAPIKVLNPRPETVGDSCLNAEIGNSPREFRPLTCKYYFNSFKESDGSTPAESSPPAENETKSMKACKSGSWTIAYWDKKNPGRQFHKVYKCKSWRHGGACRKAKGAEDFARIRDGLEKYDGWCYMVLTIGDRDRDRDDVYKRLVYALQNFQQYLKRKYGNPYKYVALIEQHRDGWPHVNILVHNPVFFAATDKRFRETRQDCKAAAERCGFGRIFWLDSVSNKEAIAGYFVKLVGEAVKMTQSPLAAPRRFRRLRASRGLLPPIFRNEGYTGRLCQQSITDLEYVDPYHAEREKKRIRARVRHDWQDKFYSPLARRRRAERRKIIRDLIYWNRASEKTILTPAAKMYVANLRNQASGKMKAVSERFARTIRLVS